MGAPAPAFTLPALAGDTSSLADLLASGRPLLLLFMDPNCGPCTALLPQVAQWVREHGDVLAFAVVSRGTPKENRKKFAEPGLPPVVLQERYEVSEQYQTLATPSAVLVRSNGRIGSTVAAGAEAITSLVERFAAGIAAPGSSGSGAMGMGTAAPVLALPDLDGRSVELASFQGRDTLVLFWNPDCGFCDRMLPDLKAWEATAGSGAPQLLVVSTGSAEANRAMGLTVPVVLDVDSVGARTLGAGGTPSAVLVDAEGRIASDLAVGAQAVFALAAPVEAWRDGPTAVIAVG
ncbi:MAG: redoxin domain-containing protein [Gemmatimonadota bacterium]